MNIADRTSETAALNVIKRNGESCI